MLFKNYISILSNLHRRGDSPHKPLLILTIIDGIEKGYIQNEKIYLTDVLINDFKFNSLKWTGRNDIRIIYPFYHMHNECFWSLVTKLNREISLTSKNSPVSLKGLREGLNYAEIDKELFFTLCDSSLRDELSLLIMETYFPFALSKEITLSQYYKDIKKDILNSTAEQYKDKLYRLRDRDSKIYKIERIARNKLFETTIKEIYNYTCCISNLYLNFKGGYSLVDACHIIPFSHTDGNDTISNGITLSPTLHRAFDKGLISIDEKYKVIVSDWFQEEDNCSHKIKVFSGRKINLPEKKEYYPSLENLCWHRENIFQK